MAYVSKEKKAKIADALKVALKNSGIKYSLAVRNHSSIVLTIRSGNIDFIGNYNAVMTDPSYVHYHPHATPEKTYIQVNVYHFRDHFTGKARDVLEKAIKCLNIDNYDNSDPMTDYFDCGHYADVNIGKWDQPYVFNKTA